MVASPENAFAHLRRIGESLVGLLAASDAVVVAEATAGTRDERDSSSRLLRSETSFRLRRTIAGRGPESETFTLAARPPPLRYASGQVAIVLVVRDRGGELAARDGAGTDRWRAVQGTGAGLVLSDGALSEEVERSLAELWSAARSKSSEAAAGALARLLEGAPRKLALMAALDLADLAHEGRLPESVASELRTRLADPELAPELRPVLEHALASPGFGEPPPRATAPAVDPRPGPTAGQ